MNELSATAKAILKAYEDSPWEYHIADFTAIEAVIRTAVDLVIPDDALYARSCCEFVGSSYRDQLLAIADELQKEALK